MSVWPRSQFFAALFVGLGSLSLAQDKPAEKPAQPAEAAKPEPQAKPAEKSDEQKAAEQKAAEELKEGIGNILNKLFPQAAPQQRKAAPRRIGPRVVQPNQLPMNGDAPIGGNAANGKRTMDAIDRLAPVDPQMQEDWQKIVKRAEKDDWQAVINGIDKLFEQGRDNGMTLKEDGRLVSIRREAMRLVARAPAEVRDTWERANLAAAEKKLAEAVAADDVTELVKVATRYFGLTPGYEAADRLVALHMDRGEHGVALEWIQELWSVKAPLTRDRAWQRKALVVARVAGEPALSKEIQAAFEGSDHEVAGSRATRFGSPQDELARIGRVAPHQVVEPSVLEDWPMLFGASNRLALPKGSDPVGMQRWALPTTGSQVLQRRIDAITDFCIERGKPTVPTTLPLLVNGRVVFRSIDGIEVVDVETGRVVWSLRDEPVDNAIARMRGMAQPTLDASLTFNPNDQSGGPLGTLLYKNSARSMLSSDGVRLFVVEDDPFATLWATSGGMMWNTRGTAGSKFGTNVLKALDLETGRTLWQAGGPSMNEELALSLAGHFLLGAPVVDGGELYVVGQKQNEIRLFALDPMNGELKWSQLLAFSELPIERDLQRRMWSVQVAISGSVIVCPTTVGWMVGVDRTRHAILWAQRYSKAGTVPENPNQPNRIFFGGANQALALDNEPIASRWAASAPVIAGNRVFFTAIENKGASDPTGVMVSLDLFTGRKHWEQTRGTMQYLAGVLSDRLLLVGLDSIKAVSFEGKDLWTQPLQPELGRISGRGVIVGNHLFQPMQRGALLKIAVQDGQIASTTKLAPGRRPLGNLAMYRGLMLSLHPGQLTAYEQQDSVTERLALLKDKAERTTEDRLFQAKLALAAGKHEDALAVLRPQPNEFTDRDAQQRYESVLRDALIRQLNQAKEPSAELNDELQRIARTPAQKFAVADLEIRRAITNDRHVDAVKRLIAELKSLPSGEFESAFDRNVSMTSHAWAQGLVREIWSRASTENRDEIAAEFTKLINETMSLPLGPESEFIAELLMFHPASIPLVQNFARQAEQEGRLRDAEHWIKILMDRSALPAIKATQALRLARLRARSGDELGAQAALDLTAAMPDDLKLPNNEPLSATRAAVQAEWKKTARAKPEPIEVEKLDVRRFQTNYQQQITRVIDPARRQPDYFGQLRMLAMSEHNGMSAERLMFEDAASGKLLWNVPLRTKQGHALAPQFQRSGNVLIVLNGNALHALSVPDRRALWTAPVETAENYFNGVEEVGGVFDAEDADYNLNRPEALVGYSLFLKRFKGPSRFNQVPVAPVTLIANSDYVGYRVRETLYVFDARTGAFRWKLDRLPTKTIVSGTESLLVTIDTVSNAVQTYAPLSGRKLVAPEFASKLANTLITYGDVAIVAHGQLANGLKGLSIEAFDCRAGKSVWRRDFSTTVRVGRLGADELVFYEQVGEVSFLRLWNGELTQCSDITPESPADSSVEPKREPGKGPATSNDRRAVPAPLRLARSYQYAFRDNDRVYLILNGQSQQWLYGETPIIPINGALMAFDRASGRRLWDKSLNNHNLLLADVNSTPALVSMQREQGNAFNGFGNDFKLLVLNKATGAALYDRSELMNDTNIRTLKWNHAGQHLDLQTYNQRLRFQFTMKFANALIPVPEDR